MSDVLIVGGGLIGMLTALELQQAGASVQILERGQMGAESSWAGGGILSPLYPWRYSDAVNCLAKYGQQVYPKIAQQIHQDSGIDPQYLSSGLIVLDQHEHLIAKDWANRWQMSIDDLPHANDIEVNLNSKYNNALHLPDIAQMRNPRLVKSLKGSLEKRDIEYEEQAEVTQLLFSAGKIQGVQVSKQSSLQKYFADKVIIAGGAWSGKIIQECDISSPDISPVKGQMIIFKAQEGLLKNIVLSGGRYLIPRQDGRIVVGSTLEYTEFNKSINDHALSDLRDSAIEILPALKNAVVEKQWAGLRPGSQQGIPYICEHPSVNNLYINSGHFRNGVILGAASAHLMSCIVLNQVSEIAHQAYDFDASH